MAKRTAEQAWADMSRGDATANDLAEGALLIAAHEYPGLDIEACLQRLRDMADALRKRLRPDISPSETLIALNHYLFQELGFRGNAADYYDARNSYLNDVIERRIGIPISLSVLYIDVGRRLGLPLEGVSFPSHFLVKCALRAGVLVLDPYAKGASVGAAELQSRLGAEAEAASRSDADLLHGLLRTATVPEVLARMLRNLKAIYLHHGDLEKALWAADRIVGLLPETATEYRARGLVYLELECFRAALNDFRNYARLAPQAAEAEGMAATIAHLQQRASRLN